MKANPGGVIAPEDVVGRDTLISRLWHVLDRQSLVLCAERRIGKTCIIQKMKAEGPPGKIFIYRDLESVRSPLEFAESTFHDVEEHLSAKHKVPVRVHQWLTHVTGIKIGQVVEIPEISPVHWKTLLSKTMEDLVLNQEKNIILFWDELPLMLENIGKKFGEDMVMEVLDALRSFRQMHPELRMVYTGSIGLHHVVASLQEAGYGNPSINDMFIQEVPSLLPEDARKLALLLLEGERIDVDDREAVVAGIASEADFIPYYIHHIVDQMAQTREICTVEAVRSIVGKCLFNPQDIWNMRHFRSRIDRYFHPEQVPIALAVLDILAGAEESISFENLFNLIKGKLEIYDKEVVLKLIDLLKRDHYICQELDGRYRFLYRLVQRWWVTSRS